MKLRITHFHDPEPKLTPSKTCSRLKESKCGCHIGLRDCEAHSAWKARQVKPEPEFCDDKSINDFIASKSLTHRKALQHYEENRLRYEGFEFCFEDKLFVRYQLNKGGTPSTTVDFYHSGEVIINHGYEDIVYKCINGLSVSLFEQICKENGIELNKIQL